MIVKLPQTQPSASASGFLSPLDRQRFAQDFNRRPFLIQHLLSEHSLFELPSLLELSQSLPATSVEYNAGDLPVNQDPNATPRNGLSVQETIRRIEENKSWLVLKNVEQHPAYAELLDACLDQMQEVIEDVSPGMSMRQGFIFVSSPGSITPYHIDPECNFLLQVRGSKTVHMFDAEDRVVLPEAKIEAFFNGAHRNLVIDPALMQRGQYFELEPGDGLHFPVVAPHWVKNGPAVSISFSITFQTDASRRRQSLHRFNRGLRKLGLRPSQVNRSPWRDHCKYALCRFGRAVKQVRGSANKQA